MPFIDFDGLRTLAPQYVRLGSSFRPLDTETSLSSSGPRDKVVLWPVWLHEVAVSEPPPGATDVITEAIRACREAGVADADTTADVLQLPRAVVDRLWSASSPYEVRPRLRVDVPEYPAFILRDAVSGDLLARFVDSGLNWLDAQMTGHRGKRHIPRSPRRDAMDVSVVVQDPAPAPRPDLAEVRRAWVTFRNDSLPGATRVRARDPRMRVVETPPLLCLLPLTLIPDDAPVSWTVWDPLTGAPSEKWRTRVEHLSQRLVWLQRTVDDMSAGSGSTVLRDLANEQLTARHMHLLGIPGPLRTEIHRVAEALIQFETGDEAASLDLIGLRTGRVLEGMLAHSLAEFPLPDAARDALQGTSVSSLLRQRLGPTIEIPRSIRRSVQPCWTGQCRNMRRQILTVALSACVQPAHRLRLIVRESPNVLEVWDRLAAARNAEAHWDDGFTQRPVTELCWDALMFASQLIQVPDTRGRESNEPAT